MKKKILYGILIIVFIIDVILTITLGLRVNLYYGEGYNITINEKDTINKKDIEQISKDVFNNNYIVQNVEFFNDSAIIKVKDVNDEDLQKIVDKLNEKYSSSLKVEDLKVEHVSNVRIRTLIEPYVIPTLISTVLVLVFYAIRYRGTKQMIQLIKYLIISEGLLYSLYAICRLKVNTMSMPIAFALYALVILVYTFVGELKKSNK